MKSRVEFLNVGRDKVSWTDEFSLDEDGRLAADDLIASIRRNGRLMSRNIGVSESEDGSGFIHAGMHTVGEWRIVDEVAQ